MYLFIDLYNDAFIYMYVCFSEVSANTVFKKILFFVRLLGPKTLVISCDMILKNAQTNQCLIWT